MKKRAFKFLVVNASPHRVSVTSRFADTFSRAAKKAGATCTHLRLYDSPPPHTDGFYHKATLASLTTWQRALYECDGVFIASPTHWMNVPSVLKTFIDQLTDIEHLLRKKPRSIGVAVRSVEGGALSALEKIILPFNLSGFWLPENACLYHVHADRAGVAYTKGSAPDDAWVWRELKVLPRRMMRHAGASRS